MLEVKLDLADTSAVYDTQNANWIVSKGRAEVQEYRNKIASLEDENRRLRDELSKV